MPTHRFVLALLITLSPAQAWAGVVGELVLHETFEQGADRWELLDPETWRHDEANGTLEITARKSDYKPPHRSPGHVALAKDIELASCRIDVRVKSTLDTGPHRDCCLFFGWQDAAHFYYVHLGAQPDPHSGQIMVVDGADRRALTDNVTPVPWTDGWHTVTLIRDAQNGRITVYFDGLDQPLMEVSDKTFGAGRVGIGSFDDLNAFDTVHVYDQSRAAVGVPLSE